MRSLDFAFLTQKLDLITAQRSLHFLRFREAQLLIGKLAQNLKPGASMYFTIGAVDCKVGDGYKHTDLPVEHRWHPLEPALGGPIHVTEPLCLYKTKTFIHCSRMSMVALSGWNATTSDCSSLNSR